VRTSTKRGGVVLALLVALGAVVTLAAGGSTASTASPAVEQSEPAADVSSLVPAYDTAALRVATSDEERVGATTPAGNARLVSVTGGRRVYIGEIAAANALCISVENPKSDRISSSCGGDKAIPAGQLVVLVSGEDEDGTFVAGAGIDAAAVRLHTAQGIVSVPVEGGVYAGRTSSTISQLEFVDSGGAEIKSLTLSSR
jgi:hypothetical protein